MVTLWSVEASLDRAWYTDVLLYSIETHLKVEIVVVVSDNLWKFDTIPDMSGVYGATYEKESMGQQPTQQTKYQLGTVWVDLCNEIVDQSCL